MKKQQISESKLLRYVLDAFDGDENVKMFRRNVGGMTKPDGQYVRFGFTGQSDLYGWIVEHGVTYATQETMQKTGKPGFCIERGKFINLKKECVQCGTHCGECCYF